MTMMKVDIGRLDKRITIQKRTVTADTKRNQIPEWTDYYTCWAAVNGVSNREYWQAREQHEENIVNFKVRYCNYDITFIDNILFADSVLNIKGAEKL